MPVIPATQEAKVGESLEPGGGGCSELRSHHCTPAWAAERASISHTHTHTHTHRERERERERERQMFSWTKQEKKKMQITKTRN